jgi:hypothetical protein
MSRSPSVGAFLVEMKYCSLPETLVFHLEYLFGCQFVSFINTVMVWICSVRSTPRRMIRPVSLRDSKTFRQPVVEFTVTPTTSATVAGCRVWTQPDVLSLLGCPECNQAHLALCLSVHLLSSASLVPASPLGLSAEFIRAIHSGLIKVGGDVSHIPIALALRLGCACAPRISANSSCRLSCSAHDI